MTSDAKVGLLLGLFFIFVIAFIINGLPRFRSDTNTNELTTAMANSPNDSYIGSNERKARASFRRERPVRNRNQSVEEAQETTRDEGEYRYKRPLSQDSVVVKDEPVTTAVRDNVKSTRPAPETRRKTTVNVPKQVKPEIYVIQAGDNLAKIAQKFYGTERGNKTLNVKRIFEANRRLLKSPNDISVGQKLIIPLLKDEAKSVFTGGTGGLFEKIKSTLSGTRSSTKTPAKPRPKPPAARPTKNYIVRAGDSVWRIAEKQLGDKERFREIIKLNALEDEDYLTVGQRLLIPVR
jgi:nucleoid-associated protein YgaU